MNKPVETLEDLLARLESARDSLLVIHNALEVGNVNEALTLNALFGAYSHLDFIAQAMTKHIEHIPAAVLQKAGEEVSA